MIHILVNPKDNEELFKNIHTDNRYLSILTFDEAEYIAKYFDIANLPSIKSYFFTIDINCRMVWNEF